MTWRVNRSRSVLQEPTPNYSIDDGPSSRGGMLGDKSFLGAMEMHRLTCSNRIHIGYTEFPWPWYIVLEFNDLASNWVGFIAKVQKRGTAKWWVIAFFCNPRFDLLGYWCTPDLSFIFLWALTVKASYSVRPVLIGIAYDWLIGRLLSIITALFQFHYIRSCCRLVYIDVVLRHLIFVCHAFILEIICLWFVTFRKISKTLN